MVAVYIDSNNNLKIVDGVSNLIYGQNSYIFDVTNISQYALAEKSIVEDAIGAQEKVANEKAVTSKEIIALQQELSNEKALNAKETLVLQQKLKNEKLIAGVKLTKIAKFKAKSAKKKVALSWGKSGAYNITKYQVWRSKKSASGYKKIATTSSKTYKNKKGLVKGKTYYYKVRGYRVVDGKVIYTSFVKIKVKVK